MSHCIFCSIIDRKIPAHIIFEDDSVIAILDITQSTIGHALIIPKKHYDNFVVTPLSIVHQVVTIAQIIAQRQMTFLYAKGVNTLMNSYSAAGQTVMHFHIHIIPRYDEHDRINIVINKHDDLSNLNLQAIAAKLKIAE
jgi:histidine triad (HIT) family protein